MKKVTKEEQYNKDKKLIKKLILYGLALIIATTTITTIRKKQAPKPYNFNVPFIEYNEASKIEIDDFILELAILNENNEVPKGFVQRGDFGYRLLSKTGIAPEGYVLSTDGITLYQVDTEIQYVYPEEENVILVGSKDVTIVNNNGKFEYQISDAEPLKGYSK